jgi:hypothetical protein
VPDSGTYHPHYLEEVLFEERQHPIVHLRCGDWLLADLELGED